MTNTRRGGTLCVALLLATALLAGCSTMGDDGGGISANDQPSQLAPVTDSAVSSDALPPIGGADGAMQVASAGAAPTDPSGQAGDANMATGSTGAAPPPSPSGAFVSLNDVGKVSTAPGRDLTGGLSVEKLLGGWTVTAGSSQCRLNLTYTAKTGTERYRASAPGCQIATLSAVSSWQLSGTQVQLFDDSDKIVGALLLSGNRFIGTLTGGQAIAMAG